MIKINEIRPAIRLRTQKKIQTFKVVLLGEMLVGKSCLINRLVKDKFHELPATVGAAYCTYTIHINNTPVKLEIWDTAGQERFHSLIPMYYRHAQAAIVVYDITNRITFENVKKWILRLKNQVPDILTILVGNKVDLIGCRSVQTEEAQNFANENDLLFIETSAKTNFHITDVFREIAENLIMTKTSPSNMTGKYQRFDEDENISFNRKCCN